MFSLHLRPYLIHQPRWRRLINGYLTADLSYALFTRHCPEPATDHAGRAAQEAYLSGDYCVTWSRWMLLSVVGIDASNTKFRTGSRLQAPWHYDAACSAECPKRRRAGQLRAAPSPSGVPVVPAQDRQAVPPELDIHCIVDNYATHSHAKLKTWLASRPRWHLHFIPTYSSWLNQVERFFALITNKVIRRGSFTSVTQPMQRIDKFVMHHNAKTQPFRWTATSDAILEKLHLLRSRITGTGTLRLLAACL